MLDDVLTAYDSAWNESDQAARAELLIRSLAENAELVDPTSGRFKGRDAINGRIADFSDRFPGVRLTLTNGVDEHNGFARYAWATDTPPAAADPASIVYRGRSRRSPRTLVPTAQVGWRMLMAADRSFERSAVDVTGRVAVRIGVVCVSGRSLCCGLVACCLPVVSGGLAVVAGGLTVEQRGHPVPCGLVIVVCAAVIGAGEFSTDAGAYVAPDSCSIALGGAAIALVSGAIVRVSVLAGH